MKFIVKLATLISCIAIIFGAVSCSEDDARLGASSPTCAFKAEGGEKIISIETTEGSWKASLSATDHFRIKQDGNQLVITSPENTSEASKSTSVTVVSGNASLIISVTQAYRVAGESGSITLNPSDTSYEFYSEGGTFRVAVSSPFSWSAESDAAWCKVAINESTGVLTVMAESNENDVTLSAKVTITAGTAAPKEIMFIQSTVAENPYTALLGWWDLYCPQWTKNGTIVPGTEGELTTHASCFISEETFNETIVINHLFLENSSRGAYYSKEDRYISIPLGWLVHYINPNSYYLALLSITQPHAYLPGTATGIISEDGNTITLEGIGGGWTIGVFSISQSETNYRIGEMYYPNSHVLTLVKRVQD